MYFKYLLQGILGMSVVWQEGKMIIGVSRQILYRDNKNKVWERQLY